MEDANSCSHPGQYCNGVITHEIISKCIDASARQTEVTSLVTSLLKTLITLLNNRHKFPPGILNIMRFSVKHVLPLVIDPITVPLICYLSHIYSLSHAENMEETLGRV